MLRESATPWLAAVLVTGALAVGCAQAATLVFQAGEPNGGTSDTWLAGGSPNTDRSGSNVVEWDGSDGGGENHALLRFDELFGRADGQITPPDEITSATLEYFVSDPGNTGTVHEVFVDWGNGVTWNTFGDDAGVQRDEHGGEMAIAPGSAGWHSVNVTNSVAAWAADPTANRGWIIRPSGSNGVEITSSEGSSSTRPRLTVVVNEGPPPEADVVRGPYLQLGTSSSAVIRWRTDAQTTSRVWYGLSQDDRSQLVDDATPKTDHEVVLTDLEPETTYFYSVGTTKTVFAGGDADHAFVTPPAEGTVRPTRIWVIGDSGTANANAAAVYDAYRDATGDAKTDLWLMLGDNAYTDGTDAEYQAAVFDMYPEMLRQTFLWSTLGNHDGHSADSASETGPYYDIFTLPRQGEAGGLASGTEAYYSFDYGNIHFICLDSYETNTAPGGAMMTWLEADLADTLSDWIIAFWHHPPYTKGSHDSDSEGRLIDMRERALPILEAGGVDLVLSGHSHSYERSFLLDGHYGSSSTLTPEMILDDGDGHEGGDGAYDKAEGGSHAGAVYVVAGSSGKISGGPLNHPAMFVSLNELGSLVLEVNGGRLDATFLRSTGATTDSFTIVKDVDVCVDVTGDATVSFADLLAVLGHWGPCGLCPEDIDGSGDVGLSDLLQVLSGWGPCT